MAEQVQASSERRADHLHSLGLHRDNQAAIVTNNGPIGLATATTKGWSRLPRELREKILLLYLRSAILNVAGLDVSSAWKAALGYYALTGELVRFTWSIADEWGPYLASRLRKLASIDFDLLQDTRNPLNTLLRELDGMSESLHHQNELEQKHFDPNLPVKERRRAEDDNTIHREKGRTVIGCIDLQAMICRRFWTDMDELEVRMHVELAEKKVS